MKVFIVVILLAFAYLINPALASTITPFSSPENSYQVLSDYISGLEKSAYISVYTFTDRDLAERLIDAKKRGVDVKIIVEDKPAGKNVMGKEFFSTLCFLKNNGVEAYLYKGKLNYIHAKYIIGDNSSSAILSGNFGPDSFGKNREWGAIVWDEKLSKTLLKVYLADLEDSDEFECNEKAFSWKASQKNSMPAKKYKSQKASLVIVPDAVKNITDFINAAEKSIYVEQFYIYKTWGGKPNLFLEAAINKARKGVDVKIIMDSNSYNVDKKKSDSNYNTLKYIENISKSEKIPIEARLADMKRIGVETVHVKGVIVDEKEALVSSINWNENSPRYNREVGVIISGDSVKYFSEKFLSDWGVESPVNYPPSGKASAQIPSKKDYRENVLEIAIFIIFVSGGMVLVKRIYKKRRKSGFS